MQQTPAQNLQNLTQPQSGGRAKRRTAPTLATVVARYRSLSKGMRSAFIDCVCVQFSLNPRTFNNYIRGVHSHGSGFVEWMDNTLRTKFFV